MYTMEYITDFQYGKLQNYSYVIEQFNHKQVFRYFIMFSSFYELLSLFSFDELCCYFQAWSYYRHFIYPYNRNRFIYRNSYKSKIYTQNKKILQSLHDILLEMCRNFGVYRAILNSSSNTELKQYVQEYIDDCRTQERIQGKQDIYDNYCERISENQYVDYYHQLWKLRKRHHGYSRKEEISCDQKYLRSKRRSIITSMFKTGMDNRDFRYFRLPQQYKSWKMNSKRKKQYHNI